MQPPDRERQGGAKVSSQIAVATCTATSTSVTQRTETGSRASWNHQYSLLLLRPWKSNVRRTAVRTASKKFTVLPDRSFRGAVHSAAP